MESILCFKIYKEIKNIGKGTNTNFTLLDATPYSSLD